MVRIATSTPLLLATLAVGVLLGWNLDRGSRTVSAQVGRPPAPSASPSEDVGPAPASTATKPQPEDGIYGQLARQYAQFEHVNRTFELVARAISPSWLTRIRSDTRIWPKWTPAGLSQK